MLFHSRQTYVKVHGGREVHSDFWFLGRAKTGCRNIFVMISVGSEDREVTWYELNDIPEITVSWGA